MKPIKLLGLAAMALAAFMAFAGTASATTLTSSAGTTPAIKAESSNTVVTGPFGFGTISCKESVIEGTIESHGASVTASWKLAKLTFQNCTGGEPTSVTKLGAFQFHGTSTTGNATVTTGFLELVFHKTLLGTCTFEAPSSGSHLGTLTGSNITKGNAVLHMSSSMPGPCGTGAFEGSYKLTNPSVLEVH
jgi:hypothetical protein